MICLNGLGNLVEEFQTLCVRKILKAVDTWDSFPREGVGRGLASAFQAHNPSLPLRTSSNTPPEGGNLAAIPSFEHSRFQTYRYPAITSAIFKSNFPAIILPHMESSAQIAILASDTLPVIILPRLIANQK
jgi:hypothetical protein